MVEDGAAGRLPLTVSGPLRGGTVELPGHLTSQFLSGLLMAGPLMAGPLMAGPLMAQGLRAVLTSPAVSAPYLEMTRAVMTAFGCPPDGDGWGVRPGSYRGAVYAIEPDASATSYLWAAGLTGGSVTVEGLGRGSAQGDVAFLDVLERMGAVVERSATATTVRDSGVLHGVDVDMADISDTAQTLAAVAVFADGPTRVRGIGFIRGKETDRIAAVVTELQRAGIDATEEEDGFTIRPGTPRPTTFATYDDHRMAMSLSVLGLRVPGIEVADPIAWQRPTRASSTTSTGCGRRSARSDPAASPTRCPCSGQYADSDARDAPRWAPAPHRRCANRPGPTVSLRLLE